MRIKNQELETAIFLANKVLGQSNLANKILKEQQVITNCGGSCSGNCTIKH